MAGDSGTGDLYYQNGEAGHEELIEDADEGMLEIQKAGANIQEVLSRCYPGWLAKTKQWGESVFGDESMNP